MSTIRDVAKESGVSVATVSYVLNNGPRPVSEVTRKRVLEVVRRLHYHPNGMARGLARKRADTIGVLFPSVEPGIITNTYAFGLLLGILTAADELGFNVTLYTESSRKRSASPGWLDRRADGLLVVAPPMDSDLSGQLATRGIPLVGISVNEECGSFPSVDVDNVKGAELATNHLISLGHKRIAHLTGDLNLVSGRDRRDGFLAAIKLSSDVKAGVVPCGYASQLREQNKGKVRSLLIGPEAPTAIFAANDALAIAAVEAAREVGKVVPNDLSIVGFDDIPSAALVTPPLTSIRQPLSEIGQHATRMLVDRLTGRELSKGPLLLEPELIVRKSAQSMAT